MAQTEHQNTVSLPEGLRHQFSALRGRLWRVETATALFLALGALLLSYLALFVSDRFWDTPVWLRVGFLTVGLAAFAFFGFVWLQRWVFRPRDQRAMAILVQKQYRRLGDRLLGIVELANEKQRPAYFSPALYRAAIGQVANQAREFDFPGAVRDHVAKRSGWVLAGLVILALVPVALSPMAAGNSLSRWIMPTADIGRFTLVSIEGLPSEQIVAHGEPFEVACAIRYRSVWRPNQVVGRFERQAPIAAPSLDGQVRIRVPGQIDPGIFRIKLGDARVALAIKPTHRPSLNELEAVVQLPAYLQYPEHSADLGNGSLQLVQGSRAQFEGKVSRALASAGLNLDGSNPVALQTRDEIFTSEMLELDGVSEVTFSWRDQAGLDSAVPWRLRIESRKDTPPTPELVDLLRDTAILESEVLDLKTAARDDFGVREVGVAWQIVAGASATNGTSARQLNYLAPGPREKQIEETFHFSPAVYGVPPDSVLELRGFAIDHLPGREPVYTAVHRIHVLGNEQHAELVRQNLESLLSHLEEVTRLEEKLAADTRAAQELPKEQMQSDEAAADIRELREEQLQNAAHLEDMAREGLKTLREAVRNPTFSEETLREWAKNLRDMQQLSEQPMTEAAEALKSAQESADSRPEDLAQASQKEQEALEALEDLQRRVNKGLDQMQALTLAQRLRKLAGDEVGIASRLQKIVPETIGMFPNELPVRFKQFEAKLATEQQGIQEETAVLQSEIGRFFERTEKESYGQVSKEMVESRITDELDRLRGLIQENISMEAMQNLASWSERLTGWADLLEPKSDSAGGGGGGGGGGESANDEALIKELLALLRVRDKEINLRRRTGLLERQKSEVEDYEQSAKALAAAQAQVREDAVAIQEQNPVPALEFPLQDIIDGMQGVQELLDKPQTDRQTDLAQTKTIALISDVINLINEQQQRGNNNRSTRSPTAEEMAFLMQMMAQQNQAQGMGANPTGGGNMSGGTTDRAATGMPGDPNARSQESRTINRAGGNSATVPSEFREALENYYKGIEAMEAKP
ncbi:MAG: hypothetical protein AB9869_17295 [Verrucomicrobiia bacterium]